LEINLFWTSEQQQQQQQQLMDTPLKIVKVIFFNEREILQLSKKYKCCKITTGFFLLLLHGCLH